MILGAPQYVLRRRGAWDVQKNERTDKRFLLAGKESDLRFSVLDVVEDRLKGRVTETAFFPRFHIILKSRTESFWAKIESVPKGFVNTIERVTTGHENLVLR